MKHGLLMVSVLSLASVGCKKQIDQAKAESSIKTGLEGKGLKVDSVSCPKDRAAKQGDTFECTGKASGKDFTVSVEQLDGEGNVKWTLKGYVLNSKEVVAAASSKLPAGASLTCADRPVTVESGPASLDCEMKNPDGKLQIKFSGTGAWEAVPVDEPKPAEPKHDDHDAAKHDEPAPE